MASHRPKATILIPKDKHLLSTMIAYIVEEPVVDFHMQDVQVNSKGSRNKQGAETSGPNKRADESRIAQCRAGVAPSKSHAGRPPAHVPMYLQPHLEYER